MSSRSRSSLCCCRRTVTGSTLDPPAEILFLAVCACACPYMWVRDHLCVCVNSDFLCAAVWGIQNGGEVTLDPDHMSTSVGWSPTLPSVGPLCSSLRAYEISWLTSKVISKHHSHHHHHLRVRGFICLLKSSVVFQRRCSPKYLSLILSWLYL